MRVFQQQKPAVAGAHPIVKRIWREINAQQASQQDLEKRSGVSASAMRKWRRNQRSPKLVDVEAVLNALGFELIVRIKIEPMIHGETRPSRRRQAPRPAAAELGNLQKAAPE